MFIFLDLSVCIAATILNEDIKDAMLKFKIKERSANEASEN